MFARRMPPHAAIQAVLALAFVRDWVHLSARGAPSAVTVYRVARSALLRSGSLAW
jgi:hypothetical protein